MGGIKYARHFPLNVNWWDLQSYFLHFSWGKRVHDDSVRRSWIRSAHEHVKCTAVCRTVHHTPAVTLHREVGSQRCDSSVRSREFKPHMRHTSTLVLHRKQKPPKHSTLKTAWECTARLQNGREQQTHAQETQSQTHLTQKAIRRFSSRNIMGQKGVADVLRVLKSKKTPNKNFLSSKVIIQKRRRDFKNFLDKQKLPEFITTKLALQEILQEKF